MKNLLLLFFIILCWSSIFLACSIVLKPGEAANASVTGSFNPSWDQLMVIIIFIEELFPFATEKHGSLSHFVFNVLSKLKK